MMPGQRTKQSQHGICEILHGGSQVEVLHFHLRRREDLARVKQGAGGVRTMSEVNVTTKGGRRNVRTQAESSRTMPPARPPILTPS